MTDPITIAIDGPAGSGKSSVSKEAARRLGFGYLDTGAAYRALAWHVLQHGADTSDAAAVVDAAGDFDYAISLDPDDYWVRADVEETYVGRVKMGDTLTVRLPSGEERQGTVFYRRQDAGFATQRDVSRTKRDIRTFEVRLRVDNRDRALAVGMTAYVLLPLTGAGGAAPSQATTAPIAGKSPNGVPNRPQRTQFVAVS